MGLSRFPEASEEGVILFFIIHTALYIAMVMDILISLLRKLGLKVNEDPPELAETFWPYASYAEEQASGLGSGAVQLAMTAEEIGNRLPVTLFVASSLSSSSSCSDADGVAECVVCLRKFHGEEEIRSLPCGHVFHTSSSSCSDADGVAECVVCLRKFHGEEEIRSLPCGHVFHTSSSSCSDADGVAECVVCLRKFHGEEEIRSLPCGHVFHKSCVDKWILDYENMTCPLCRLCFANVHAEDDGSLMQRMMDH